jgi:flagellar motor component MotA
MTLTKEQFNQFVENYVSLIVEGLDVEQLETIAFDLLVREYESHTEEQIVNEIKDIYGDELAADLLESASDVPVA